MTEALPNLSSGQVLFEVRNAVATITLNRPEAVNALTHGMREDLAVLARWCSEQRETVRAVVLAGAGRAFCAGQDLKEAEPAGPVPTVEAKRQGDFQTLLADLPQPTIAALHGYVLGRGLEVALTCDIRLAADDVQIGLPEVTLGMIASSGGTQRLPRLIGPARALHLLLTAERVPAQRALEWGLVTEVVPAAELRSRAQAVGERLAQHAPLAMRYTRRAVLEGSSLSLAEGLQLEVMLAALLKTTQDRQEGFQAFREKRIPHFTGN